MSFYRRFYGVALQYHPYVQKRFEIGWFPIFFFYILFDKFISIITGPLESPALFCQKCICGYIGFSFGGGRYGYCPCRFGQAEK